MLSRKEIQCLVITVEERREKNRRRFESVKKIFPLARQVQAVDARKFTDDQIREVVTDEVYNSVKQERSHTKGEINSKGAVGCFLSHAKCWAECVQSNRPIIVAEDDALVSEDMIELYESIPPEAIFASLVHSYTPQWFFSTQPRKVSKHWNRVGQDLWGTMMYYVTPTAARLLLERGRLVTMHVDIFISQVAMAHEDESMWLQSSAKYNQFSKADLLTASTIGHKMSLKKLMPENNFTALLIWALPAVFVLLLMLYFIKKK